MERSEEPAPLAAGGAARERACSGTPIRLALIDVDGTLVGRHGVHPTTAQALESARRAWLRIAVSTGRLGVGTAEEYARLVDPVGLHVFQSGAVISRPGTPAVYRSELSDASVRRLTALSRDLSIPIELYTEREIRVEAPTAAIRLHAEHLGADLRIGDLTEVAEPVVSAVWVIPQSELPRIEAALIGIDDLDAARATTPWAPGLVFVNLTRVGTSKASALCWLARRYGLSTAEVAMIGDGANDLDAMTVAGYAVAMGDAPDEVRSTCHATVAPCDEGGLAEALSLVTEVS